MKKKIAEKILENKKYYEKKVHEKKHRKKIAEKSQKIAKNHVKNSRKSHENDRFTVWNSPFWVVTVVKRHLVTKWLKVEHYL